MRQFESGATRDVDTTKLDYEGFLHPSVLDRFAEYMHENRVQADGSLRGSDNWQKGIPKDVYMKSAFRHFMDLWKEHRGIKTDYGLERSICALMFNIQGYLFEHLKEKQVAQSESNRKFQAIQDEWLQPLVDYTQQAAKKVIENGDYDPRHDAPLPSPAVLVASEILELHSQRPPGQVDPLAPESCVSRCY